MRTPLPLAALALAAASCGSASQVIQENVAQTPSRALAPSTASAKEWDGARAGIVRTFAFRALERNLVEEARGYLREACEMDPTDTACHAALARLFLAEGDARAALPYARQAARTAPKNAEANLVLAAALAENQRGEEATEYLKKVWLASGPRIEVARALLTHHASLGGTQAARVFVEDLQVNQPLESNTWAISGDLDLAEGEVDAAADNYQRALDIDPSLSVPVSLHSRLDISTPGKDPIWVSALDSESRGDWKGAGRLFRFLVQTRPEDWRARSGLARSLWREGRTTESSTILVQVPVAARDWRDHMLAAKIAIHTEAWEGARGSLLVALELRPGLEAAELLLQRVQEEIERGSKEDA